MIFGFSPLALGILIGSILIAMTIHEMMHAYVSLLLGDTTAAERGRISLNPLNHIDPFMTVLLPVVTLVFFRAPVLAAKPVPFNPARVRYGAFGAALIALAGPLSNLGLAVLAAGLAHLVTSGTLFAALYLFVELNVALCIFNLIPIPPLDGSRVLFAVAPEPVQDIMRGMERYGLVIIFTLVLLGGFNGVLANINQTVLNLLLGGTTSIL